MAFKDNFRIEKIYFQRVKDDAQILGSWKNDPRRYSREEIVRVAKDACDSILMLYRLIGECWNDALNQIEKLSAELEALAGKTEAYHDELNEKIDEVNNYLNTQIKNLEIRVENIENSIEDFGGLPSNENAEEGDVLTVGENHVNEWKKPSGGECYIIWLEADPANYTFTLSNRFTPTVADGTATDKTPFDIMKEYANGKCDVRLRLYGWNSEDDEIDYFYDFVPYALHRHKEENETILIEDYSVNILVSNAEHISYEISTLADDTWYVAEPLNFLSGYFFNKNQETEKYNYRVSYGDITTDDNCINAFPLITKVTGGGPGT